MRNVEQESYFRNKVVIINFLLSIFVLYTHATNIEIYSLEGVIGKFVIDVERYMANIYSVAVPTFFILSGFLFFRNFSAETWKQKIKSRIHSLLIPYIIWSFGGYLYLVILKQLPLIGERINIELRNSIKDMLYDVLFSNIPMGHMWYLRNLMLFVVIVPFIIYLIKKCVYKHQVILICVLCIGGLFYMKLSICLTGILYFFIGTALAVLKVNVETTCKSKKIVGAICLVTWLLLCINWSNNYYYFIIRNIIGSVGIWFSYDIVYMIRDQYSKPREAPKWWMKISFFVYCAHYLVLESIEKVIWIIGKNNVIFAIVDYLFAPIICFIVLVSIAYILKKIPKVWQVLSGNRG